MSQLPSATVFHLEMKDREAFRPSDVCPGLDVTIVDPPDPELNRQFYRAVGSEWQWTDRLSWSDCNWRSYLRRGGITTYVGRLDGREVGYFELETQEAGNVEIVYFGLLPECIGQGLGGSLLSAAVARAWELETTVRVWVHTCTLDHQRALENYRARGFEVFKTVQE